MTQPAQFTILIEKYRRGRLNYTTRWVSIGSGDVISVEGHRYRLAKISGGNTRLLFKLDDKSSNVAKPNAICIPHNGEAAIEKFSVIWESWDDSDRMAVAQMQLTQVQLSPLIKNNPYLAVGDLIPRQQYSKNRSDAVRVEAKEGNDLIVGDQRYSITRIVEPDTNEDVVGWIEISQSHEKENK